ncbi:hypothetical protein FB567DRAFT_590730 [Paraphoma chrysanthemicola]|uniref:Uncharacterized protein n=1 Tax=Paraphoma chrysanthemicola TaxID=798071 RepID=A0A8K0R9R9_9PLEO|nr:hypothetical protein FB567DRAFT_590730 [Paraphoma chrysanthemicola]
MERRRSISPLSSCSRNSSDDGSIRANPAQPLGTKTNHTQIKDTPPQYSVLEQDDANEPKNDQPTAPIRQQSWKQRIALFGWWWEFGSILVAIASTAAIVAVLAKVDDSPIATWNYSIQPASLVSIFSAIAKSALLVPIAVCLGQLKWNYFEKPRSLDYMQVFDDASRGPWGSTIFLWKTKGMARLAGIGAVVTVLLTTFEPFSQQAISFNSKDTRLYGNWAGIAWTDTLSDLQFNWGASLIADVRFNFTISMMQAMTEKPTLYQSTTCPDKECRFQNFTTLGACNKCETERIDIEEKFGCRYYTLAATTSSSTNRQNYSTFQEFKDAVTTANLPDYGMDCLREKTGFPPFNINLERRGNDTASLIGMGRPQDTSNISNGSFSQDAVFGNTYYTKKGDHFLTTVKGWSFRFCASGYNRTQLGGDNEKFDTIGTYTCFMTSWDPGPIFDLDTFGQFRGDLSYCRMSLCAQEFRDVVIYNDTLHHAPVVESPLKAVGNAYPGDVVAEAENGKRTFQIGPRATDMLKQMFETVLYSKAFIEFMVNSSDDGKGWAEVFKRIAPVARDYIRSNANDVVQTAVGTVYGQQTFFRVSWAWIIMPLLLVVMSIAVLITTAIYSRRKPFLFKNSVIAPMRYRIEDWKPDERAMTHGARETDIDLVKSAESVRARLIKTGDGSIKFVRG